MEKEMLKLEEIMLEVKISLKEHNKIKKFSIFGPLPIVKVCFKAYSKRCSHADIKRYQNLFSCIIGWEVKGLSCRKIMLEVQKSQ